MAAIAVGGRRDYHYHMGTASTMSGQASPSRSSLRRARSPGTEDGQAAIPLPPGKTAVSPSLRQSSESFAVPGYRRKTGSIVGVAFSMNEHGSDKKDTLGSPRLDQLAVAAAAFPSSSSSASKASLASSALDHRAVTSAKTEVRRNNSVGDGSNSGGHQHGTVTGAASSQLAGTSPSSTATVKPPSSDDMTATSTPAPYKITPTTTSIDKLDITASPVSAAYSEFNRGSASSSLLGSTASSNGTLATSVASIIDADDTAAAGFRHGEALTNTKTANRSPIAGTGAAVSAPAMATNGSNLQHAISDTTDSRTAGAAAPQQIVNAASHHQHAVSSLQHSSPPKHTQGHQQFANSDSQVASLSSSSKDGHGNAQPQTYNVAPVAAHSVGSPSSYSTRSPMLAVGSNRPATNHQHSQQPGSPPRQVQQIHYASHPPQQHAHHPQTHHHHQAPSYQPQYQSSTGVYASGHAGPRRSIAGQSTGGSSYHSASPRRIRRSDELMDGAFLNLTESSNSIASMGSTSYMPHGVQPPSSCTGGMASSASSPSSKHAWMGQPPYAQQQAAYGAMGYAPGPPSPSLAQSHLQSVGVSTPGMMHTSPGMGYVQVAPPSMQHNPSAYSAGHVSGLAEYDSAMYGQTAHNVQPDYLQQQQQQMSQSQSSATPQQVAQQNADYQSIVDEIMAQSRKGADFGLELGDFEMLDTLGTGTFGRVLLVKLAPRSATGLAAAKAFPPGMSYYFAMKVLTKSEVVRLKQVEHINCERSILGAVEHPGIVNLFCTFQDSLNIYMLLEFVQGGELFSHLRRAVRFSADVSRFYAANIILVLEYLHNRNLIYRDLKPENLLLDSSGYLKVTDFGFAKYVPDRTFTLCGTPEYLAPEIINSAGHGKAADWWAFGVLLFEMLCGYPPFFDESPWGIYEKILAGNFAFPPHVDPVARDLIRRLLSADRSKRLGNLRNGALDVKNHKWFEGVDWASVERKGIPAPIVPRIKSTGDSQNFERYPSIPIESLPGLAKAHGLPVQEMQDPFETLFLTF